MARRGTAALAGKSIFTFQVPSAVGSEPVSLNEFKGAKAYLLVNVASR
jgi:glutathione peroxidase-family protein